MNAPRIGLACATVLRAGLIELIEIAARHGFATITARPASVAAALEQGASEAALRKRLRDAGVAVRMIDAFTHCLPGASTLDPRNPAQRHLPPEVFEPPDEEACFRAAELLEAPFLNVTHFGQEPVPPEAIVPALADLCRRAGGRGIGVALEFIPGTGLPDLITTHRIARDCGERNCGITFDPWHWSRSGGTLDDVRQLEPGAVFGMQLCDRIAPPPGTAYTPMTGRLMPGDGELPLVELVRAVLANSPGISIEAEVLNDELRDLGPDGAAGRVAEAVAIWRAGFAARDPG